MATFVLTVLGDDRAGLVSALSRAVTDHGGNWERSQLAQLAGKFAGIVEASVADERYDELVAGLGSLACQGLHVAVERGDVPAVPTTAAQSFVLELLGDDRPGIVAEVSAVLAAHEVSIQELVTEVRDAPMAGGTLFEARALLVAPSVSATEALRSALEGLADELMVEVVLSDR